MTLETINTELSEAINSLVDNSNTMAKMSGDSCDIYGTLQSVLDSATAPLIKLAESALIELGNAVASIAGALVPRIQQALQMATEATLAVLQAIASVVGGMVVIAGAAVAAISTAFDAVFSAVAGIASIVSGVFCAGVAAVASVVTNAVSNPEYASIDAANKSGSFGTTAEGAAAVAASATAQTVATSQTATLTAALGPATAELDALLALLGV